MSYAKTAYCLQLLNNLFFGYTFEHSIWQIRKRATCSQIAQVTSQGSGTSLYFHPYLLLRANKMDGVKDEGFRTNNACSLGKLHALTSARV
jgi:hypothetical protein